MTVSQWSDLPLVLTTEQAAVVLQLKRRTIANMLDRGDLRGVKVGKDWRVSRSELIRFVEGHAQAREHAASSPEREARLVNKGGVLVAQAEPTEDLSDFVAREREERISGQAQEASQ
jgi:excisionase family DNA binding protein